MFPQVALRVLSPACSPTHLYQTSEVENWDLGLVLTSWVRSSLSPVCWNTPGIPSPVNCLAHCSFFCQVIDVYYGFIETPYTRNEGKWPFYGNFYFTVIFSQFVKWLFCVNVIFLQFVVWLWLCLLWFYVCLYVLSFAETFSFLVFRKAFLLWELFLKSPVFCPSVHWTLWDPSIHNLLPHW